MDETITIKLELTAKELRLLNGALGYVNGVLVHTEDSIYIQRLINKIDAAVQAVKDA